MVEYLARGWMQRNQFNSIFNQFIFSRCSHKCIMSAFRRFTELNQYRKYGKFLCSYIFATRGDFKSTKRRRYDHHLYIFLSRSFAEYDAVFHFERTIKDFLRPTVLFTFPQCIFPLQLQCFHYSLSNSKELLLVATSAIQCVITAMQQTASSIPNYSRTNISILYCKTKTQYSGEILGAGTIVLHRKLYHCNHKYVQITHWFSGHVPNHPSWLNVTVISEYMHVTVATPSGYYVLRIHTKTSK